jgi:hypothetical protein
VYGAASLFLARYSRGDAYPPYSSFRADPLGTKALFEALQSVPGVRVERNVEPLARVAVNRTVTLFVNGLAFGAVGTSEMDGELASGLQKVMLRGGRVVISFSPVVEDIAYLERKDDEFQKRMDERLRRQPTKKDDAKPDDEKNPDSKDSKAEKPKSAEKHREETIVELPPESDGEKAEQKKEAKDEEDEKSGRMAEYEAFAIKPVRWDDQWGVDLRFGSLVRDPATNMYKPETAQRAVDLLLPEQLPVHTTLYFEPKSDQWRTIYSTSGHAVLIERPVGDGTLVLVADAYLLSNEAMRVERHPDFLAWLAGPNGSILFDEVTLGTERSRGMASLVWQYRLQGVVAALVLMAALFIWKNGQPLVPPFHDSLPTDAYAYVGKDSASGFTNLLRRSVPASQVLRTCLGEWEKSFVHRAADLAESVRDAKAIVLREDGVPAKQRDLVRAYKEICAAFARHRLG